MSGVEAIGFVLAAIPLFISAAEHTKGTITKFKTAKNRQRLLDKYVVDLNFQRGVLGLLLQRLLVDAGDQYETADLDSVDWSDPQLAFAIKLRLGEMYPYFLAYLQRSEDTLESQIFKYYSKLKDATNAHVTKSLLARFIMDAKAAMTSLGGDDSIWARVKFVWEENDRLEALEEIKGANENLETIWKFAGIDFAPKRPTQKPHFAPEPIYSVRHQAEQLHKVLQGCCHCSCLPPHRAKLRLKRCTHQRGADESTTFHTILFPRPSRAYDTMIRMDQESNALQSKVKFLVTDHTQKSDCTATEDLISDLCHFFERISDIENNITLRLFKQQLFQDLHQPHKYGCDMHRAPKVWSLSDALTLLPKSRVPQKMREQKALLSVILAYSVLQLHGSPWLDEYWSKKNVVFVRDGSKAISKTRQFDLHDPCVTTNLHDLGGDSDDEDPVIDKIIEAEHPVPTLLSLGIVLLELHLGRSIDSVCAADPAAKIRSVALDLWEKDLYDSAPGEELYEAVGYCLTLSPSPRGLKRGFEHASFREHYCAQVIARLEAHLESFEIDPVIMTNL